MESYTGQALNLQDVRIVDNFDPLGYKDINAPGASTTVTIRDSVSGEPLSLIFSDNGVTPLANPFNTDSEGGFTFYAANGLYDIIINEGLGTEFRIGDVSIYDQLDLPTTTQLISSNRDIKTNSIIETSGFTLAGDKGGAKWISTGNTIAASQTPALTGNATLSNASGDEYSLVSDGTINVNKLNDVTAAYNAVKLLTSSLGDQYPDENAVTLYFPSGIHNKAGSLIDIVVGVTGFNIIGDGNTSRLDNIQITMDGSARSSIRNFMMTGSTGYGIKSNSSGAFLSRQNIFSNLYIRDKTNGVIIDGSTWNTWSNIYVEKSVGDGWIVTNTQGEQFQGCYSVTNSGKGIYIESGGEFKVSNFTVMNNVGFGVHLFGDDTLTNVEHYFTSLTTTGQQRNRLLNITAIVTHADGIQVTTSTAHELAADMEDIQVTGTTNYNGTHNTVTIIDSTNFTLDVTYVANESSGAINLPNWDMVIESDSTSNVRVNDMFFQGGNINYCKVQKGYNIIFEGTRLKNQFFVGTGSNRIFRIGSARGRQTNSFNDINASGDGLDGLAEILMSDNSSSTLPGTMKIKIKANGHELSVGPDGVASSLSLSGDSGVISDDTAFSFTPAVTRGVIKLNNSLGQNARVIEVTFDTSSGETALAGFQGTQIERANGVLTGTTGTDTKITVSAASDGKIYLENRQGSNQTLRWLIT